ncbi:hypothetical protein [Streptomyces shenzhenensis]
MSTPEAPRGPRCEPAPGPGRALLWILVSVPAAVAVVLGGVCLT